MIAGTFAGWASCTCLPTSVLKNNKKNDAVCCFKSADACVCPGVLLLVLDDVLLGLTHVLVAIWTAIAALLMVWIRARSALPWLALSGAAAALMAWGTALSPAGAGVAAGRLAARRAARGEHRGRAAPRLSAP